MATNATRKISAVYNDPLDLIWLQAAAGMGIEVRRDAEVFASWDGAGVLRIGTPETLDADDSLAQLILHEVCHALVEGPDALSLPDWGLNIQRRDQRVREYACLRLQAALTTPYGLRKLLASTTDFREYYDALPADPLDANTTDNDPAVEIACAAWKRADSGDWAEALRDALKQTAELAAIISKIAPPDSIWSLYEHQTPD